MVLVSELEPSSYRIFQIGRVLQSRYTRVLCDGWCYLDNTITLETQWLFEMPGHLLSVYRTTTIYLLYFAGLTVVGLFFTESAKGPMRAT